jgi:hypothetical protein
MTGPRQLADALIVAERERKPIAAFTDAYPFLDVGRAYEEPAWPATVVSVLSAIEAFDGLGSVEIYG